MVWSNKRYPDSMKNLRTPTRRKAIEIANALLEEGYEEGRAISIAIQKAKESVGDQSPPQHIVPHERGWAIISEKFKKPNNIFNTKEQAVKKGHEIAKNQNVRLIIHKQDGTIQKHQVFN
ncbi:uncharacterized protein YdaT [Bacillus mesophilus]|uniref:DUF2188 domain-containing protein n=1 Tax=Bacillus mesophilus TaxID=1808955 RepID=A0A6M0Q8K1_9BACI|nr:uncharacterized protein YdaT [Bacillus mesophilus]NEY72587.1 DUF2188 domain-containing protein [Bacillus mesophilus]